jgi:ParB family transcriptional regulator, chromosome partitioning protein
MARKPGLGKGLGAIIPTGPEGAAPTTTSTETSGGPLRRVAVADIRPNSYQPRQHFNEESLNSLAASIAELGVLQPIIVRPDADNPGKFELIAGERRWRAAQIAKLNQIPVLVQSDVDDVNSLERAIVENLHREDLNPLEEAAAYQQLINDFGMTHEAIAKRVGKSRTNITNSLRLLNLSETAQVALNQRQISAGHARALLAISNAGEQATMLARIIKNELSVRDTEEAIRLVVEAKINPSATKSAGKSKKPDLRPVPDASVAELEKLLEDFLDTRVRMDLRDKSGNGRIIIDFADLDDLERIYNEIVNPKR